APHSVGFFPAVHAPLLFQGTREDNETEGHRSGTIREKSQARIDTNEHEQKLVMTRISRMPRIGLYRFASIRGIRAGLGLLMVHSWLTPSAFVVIGGCL